MSETMLVFTKSEMADLIKTAVKDAISEGLRKPEETKGKEYLTIREVLANYKVSRSTLFRWRRTGFLKPRIFGPRSLYLKSELEKVCELR